MPQKLEYFGKDIETPKDIVKEEQEKVGLNVEKMRRKMTNFGKQFKEFPQMQISFYTRAKGIEVCFGSVYKEEANIAASILRSLLKLNVEVRVLICQNIVLAGGSCMVPGFKLRLRQEMVHLIESKEEFKDLVAIKDLIEVPDNQFPPNCLTWVGASLVASLNTEIDRFFVSPEDFSKNGDKMPDRFGEAYLFALRDEPYLNADFEYKNQYAK